MRKAILTFYKEKILDAIKMLSLIIITVLKQGEEGNNRILSLNLSGKALNNP